jgi:hypothetical protein
LKKQTNTRPLGARLHLKWGKALIYAGKPGEARKQFALADGLELSPADKRELAKATTPHA